MLEVCMKNMKKINNGKKRNSTYLLANTLTFIFKKLKISVEQGMVITTLNKHTQALNIMFSVVVDSLKLNSLPVSAMQHYIEKFWILAPECQ